VSDRPSQGCRPERATTFGDSLGVPSSRLGADRQEDDHGQGEGPEYEAAQECAEHASPFCSRP
jgi:hypothetical protein